jgi:hypothetical protein
LFVILDIFIIDSSTGGVMESTLSHETEYVLEMDIGSESQQDEVWEQRWTNVSDEVFEFSW